MKTGVLKNSDKKITRRDLRKLRSNLVKFKQELAQIDWTQLEKMEDIDKMVQFYTDSINEVLDKLAPWSTKTMKKKTRASYQWKSCRLGK